MHAARGAVVMQEPARREGKHQQRGRRHLDKVATRKSGAFGTGLTDKKMTGGGRRRSRRDEGQVTTTSHGAAESCRKKEFYEATPLTADWHELAPQKAQQ